MTDQNSKPCTAFDGTRLLSSGPLIDVALAVKDATDTGASRPILVFDDADGRVVDLDLCGAKADLVARLSQDSSPAADTPQPRGRGRPALGVVPREITLLPRHWTWLAEQPGGASVALRKLVEQARRADAPRQQSRTARERAYAFMSAMAGDMPGFEEATRALFADDRLGFEQHVMPWPEDVRGYAIRLAFEQPVQPSAEVTPEAARPSSAPC
jgi:uncharacterized protein